MHLIYTSSVRLKDVKVKYTPCGGGEQQSIPLCCNLNSGPQFFVFVGVMAFLYCLGTIVVYAFFDDKWKRIEMAPIIVKSLKSHSSIYLNDISQLLNWPACYV